MELTHDDARVGNFLDHRLLDTLVGLQQMLLLVTSCRHHDLLQVAALPDVDLRVLVGGDLLLLLLGGIVIVE